MKKLVVLLATVVMVLSCVACGGKEVAGNNAAKVEIADANEILTKAWDEYKASASEDIQFPVAGGNVEAMVMDAPAKFELTYDSAKEVLVYSYCIPEEAIDMTDDIATMMNMMMANNFSVSRAVREVVGSSKMMISGLRESSLAISTSCLSPGESFSTKVSGETFRSTISRISRVRLRRERLSMKGVPFTFLKLLMNMLSTMLRLLNRFPTAKVIP